VHTFQVRAILLANSRLAPKNKWNHIADEKSTELKDLGRKTSLRYL
jgi:hypothetical protein